MKYFWSLILLFLTTCLISQTDTLHLYQLYSSFTSSEKAEWTAFQNNWSFFEYNKIKQKHHIKKLDCKTCESLYADIYIEISATGNISVCEIKMLKKCGITSHDKELLLDFNTSILGYAFKTLRNKKMIVRFGNVLKC